MHPTWAAAFRNDTTGEREGITFGGRSFPEGRESTTFEPVGCYLNPLASSRARR
jgi:hypothetical protein